MDPLLIAAVTATGGNAEQWHAAHRDQLTGLANRAGFAELANVLLAEPGHRSLVLLLIDIEEASDPALATTGRRIADYASGFLTARLDKRRFAALVASLNEDIRYPDPKSLACVLAVPFQVAGEFVQVSPVVGLARVAGDTDIGEVMRRAETDLRLARMSKRNQAPERVKPRPASRRALVTVHCPPRRGPML